jgi:hypothetical protein
MGWSVIFLWLSDLNNIGGSTGVWGNKNSLVQCC